MPCGERAVAASSEGTGWRSVTAVEQSKAAATQAQRALKYSAKWILVGSYVRDSGSPAAPFAVELAMRPDKFQHASGKWTERTFWLSRRLLLLEQFFSLTSRMPDIHPRFIDPWFFQPEERSC